MEICWNLLFFFVIIFDRISESHYILVNPSESEWTKVNQSEPKKPKWIQVNPSEPKWTQVKDINGPHWCLNDPAKPRLTPNDPDKPCRTSKDLDKPQRTHTNLNRPQQTPKLTNVCLIYLTSLDLELSWQQLVQQPLEMILNSDQSVSSDLPPLSGDLWHVTINYGKTKFHIDTQHWFIWKIWIQSLEENFALFVGRKKVNCVWNISFIAIFCNLLNFTLYIKLVIFLLSSKVLFSWIFRRWIIKY